jgi:quercetin dioxygenase-like cupin family protein
MRNRILALAAVACAASLALAQAPAIKRTLLQRGDATPEREVVLAMAEIASGGATGRHTHPGVETGYILEGTTILSIEGEPVRTLHVGDTYIIPAGRVHDARADGGTAKVLATYVVEKGKPLASPAP